MVPFEQIINSSDWDPDEAVTSSDKATLVNILLYEETVVWRGKKVEAIREGLKAMGFARYFGKDATKSFFLGGTRSFRLQTYGKSNKIERE